MAYEGYERDLEEFSKEVERDANISHLLFASPFSSIRNANYGCRLSPKLFRELFYVDGICEEEEGASLSKCGDEILAVLRDSTTNLVLITGYQGCGKSIFIHYLTAGLSDGDIDGRRVRSNILDFEGVRSAGNSLFPNDEEAGKFKNALIEHLRSRALLYDSWDVGEYKKRQRAFTNLFEAKAALSEKSDYDYSITAFAHFYSDMPASPTMEDKRQFVQLAHKMDMRSLFLVLCMHVLACEAFEGDCMFHHVFVYDNLDDEIDENKIRQFITCFSEFADSCADFFNGMRDLKVEGSCFDGCEFYRNFSFIFCVRDTNAAKFSEHLAGRAVYFERDISKVVPRREIIKRRIAFLERCDLMRNAELASQAETYRMILHDKFFFENIYPMFNNDQRKTAIVLQRAFFENTRYALEYRHLIAYRDGETHGNAVFGAHGIVLRLLLDMLNREGWLRRIGGLNTSISIPRHILTMLYNKTPKHCDGGASRVRKTELGELWDSMVRLDNIALSSFVESISSMHALFDSEEWSHLLEIDSEFNLSAGDLLRELELYLPKGRRSNLYITCSGRVFVSAISSHFEYFAARYASSFAPLFSGENIREVDGSMPLDSLLKRVLKSVKSCAACVRENDKMIAKHYFDGSWEAMGKSDYLFGIFAPDGEDTGKRQTHTERICASHISYLDAYRMFLLGVDQDEEAARVLDRESKASFRRNRKHILNSLIAAIGEYVALLEEERRSDHMTEMGYELYIMFKAAYLKVVRGLIDPSESGYPIGQLKRIRGEFAAIASAEDLRERMRKVEEAPLILA